MTSTPHRSVQFLRIARSSDTLTSMQARGIRTLVACLLAGTVGAPSHAAQITTEYGLKFVTVGDPGNIPYTGGPGYAGAYGAILNVEGRGRVDYAFRISKTEIASAEYLEFFNTFGPLSQEYADVLWAPGGGLRIDPFASQSVPGEVAVLSPKLMAGRVRQNMTWRQAAMYVNWLNNGKSTEFEDLLHGAYTIDLDATNGAFSDQAEHSPDARFWIPSIDEYLKAVHYDPDKNGQGPGWWDYPHSSDVAPVPGLPGEGETIRGIDDEMIQAYFDDAVITATTLPNGLYPDTQSPWGVIDVLGGAAEWMEGAVDFPTSFRPLNRLTNVPFPGHGHEFVFAVDADSPNFAAGSFHIATNVPTAPALALGLVVSPLLASRRIRR